MGDGTDFRVMLYKSTLKELSGGNVWRKRALRKRGGREVDGEEDDGMVMVEGEAGDKPTITGGEEVTMVNAIALHPRFGNRCFDMP